MERRKFLDNVGILGAGLVGAKTAARGGLHAATRLNTDSHLKLEEKTRGIYRTPFAVPL